MQIYRRIFRRIDLSAKIELSWSRDITEIPRKRFVDWAAERSGVRRRCAVSSHRPVLHHFSRPVRAARSARRQVTAHRCTTADVPTPQRSQPLHRHPIGRRPPARPSAATYRWSVVDSRFVPLPLSLNGTDHTHTHTRSRVSVDVIVTYQPRVVSHLNNSKRKLNFTPHSHLTKR